MWLTYEVAYDTTLRIGSAIRSRGLNPVSSLIHKKNSQITECTYFSFRISKINELIFFFVKKKLWFCLIGRQVRDIWL